MTHSPASIRPDSATRYSTGAVALHWVSALLVLTLLPLGLWMHRAITDPATRALAYQAFQVHKSLGLTLIAVLVMRIAWRLAHPSPAPLPAPMWQHRLAEATHTLLYWALIVATLSGWTYVSAQYSPALGRELNAPTFYFGFIKIPPVLDLALAPLSIRARVAAIALALHQTMAWLLIALVGMHVGAALLHAVILRDGVMARMLAPSRANREPKPRRSLLGLYLAAAFVTLVFMGGVALLGMSPWPRPELHTHPTPQTVVTEPVGATPAPALENGTSVSAPVAAWIVDHGASVIAFRGALSGAPIEGRFEAWTAQILFDPNQLKRSRLRVAIETASASDGVAMHDDALKTTEWFDTAHFPQATFTATRFENRAATFHAIGSLSIKDRTLPLTLPFRLTIDGDRAEVFADATISRAAANLGLATDPNGEFVSDGVAVRIHLVARRQH